MKKSQRDCLFWRVYQLCERGGIGPDTCKNCQSHCCSMDNELLNEKSEGGRTSRRKNADCYWKCEPLDNWMKANNAPKRSTNKQEIDKHCKMLPGENAQNDKTIVDKSEQILHRVPQSTSATKEQQPLKRYTRTQSETMIGYRSVTTPTKLKRVLSASEIKTRLAGCPQGLLIATEAPKSGESYRRRSNTDVKAAVLGNNSRSSIHAEQEVNQTAHQENSSLLQEKETILLELEAVKRERERLKQENEKLQEELENRNKVIDHLIDFMKSSIPGESGEIGDDFNEV